MTTGQYPKSRETPEQAEQRVAGIKERNATTGEDYGVTNYDPQDKQEKPPYVPKSEREKSDDSN